MPEIIEPEHVHEIAAQFSLRLASRLPSRHPSRSDLLAALRFTRKPSGRLNKTRAALYLGWDPDTLVARMHDAGIGEDLTGASDDGGWKVDSADATEASTATPDAANDTLSRGDGVITPFVSNEVERQETAARGSALSRTSVDRRATRGDSAPEEEGPRALHDAHGP